MKQRHIAIPEKGIAIFIRLFALLLFILLIFAALLNGDWFIAAILGSCMFVALLPEKR